MTEKDAHDINVGDAVVVSGSKCHLLFAEIRKFEGYASEAEFIFSCPQGTRRQTYQFQDIEEVEPQRAIPPHTYYFKTWE